jgi:hypothetical protein
MNREFNINLRYCFRADDIQVRLRSLVPTWIFFLQGVLHSSSLPDYIKDKKSGGQQQSNSFPVSAGSDLRMSPLRPNPYLSIGVKMRKSKFRGFFQLFSRPN